MNLKMLTTQTDIFKAINTRAFPVLHFDLTNTDEFGFNGPKFLFDINRTNRFNGQPYYLKAGLKIYNDTQIPTIKEQLCVLSNIKTYDGIQESIAYLNAPIIKPDQQFILVLNNPKNRRIAAMILTMKKPSYRDSPYIAEFSHANLPNVGSEFKQLLRNILD